MHRIKRIRRLAVVVAGLALAAWLGLAAAPTAFARVIPPPGEGGAAPVLGAPTVTRTVVVVGGMPGWQIALIAAAAALVAAALAVLADRARAAHRKTAAAA
ncbi:MAG: hypothetical protein ACRDP7_42200 [Trebonia sp.]